MTVYTRDSYYGLTLDPRWTHGTFTRTREGGTPETFTLPFLGWTNEVIFLVSSDAATPRQPEFANEVEVSPLFWDADLRQAVTANHVKELNTDDVEFVELHSAPSNQPSNAN